MAAHLFVLLRLSVPGMAISGQQMRCQAQALSLGPQYSVSTQVLLQQIASGTPIAGTSINRYFPNPYSIQWTFAVQRQIGRDMALDVAYVGNEAFTSIWFEP